MDSTHTFAISVDLPPSERRPALAAPTRRDRTRAACVRAQQANAAACAASAGVADPWVLLGSGAYVLVDLFDERGESFLVARRASAMDDDDDGSGELSVRESRVATYVAMGHPLKVAAYELGLSVATAGRACASAIAKLGLASRLDLAAQLSSLLGPAPSALPTAAVVPLPLPVARPATAPTRRAG